MHDPLEPGQGRTTSDMRQAVIFLAACMSFLAAALLLRLITG